MESSSKLISFEYGKWTLEEKYVFINEENSLRFPLSSMVSPQISLVILFHISILYRLFIIAIMSHFIEVLHKKDSKMYLRKYTEIAFETQVLPPKKHDFSFVIWDDYKKEGIIHCKWLLFI